MKKTFLFILSLFACSFVFAQGKKEYTCKQGLTFEISKYTSWGSKKPVVLSVIPYSPANICGLESGDIIEKIDNVITEGKTVDEISQMLNKKSEIVLEVSNLKEQNRETLLSWDCQLLESIDEEQLASAYAFYDLEENTKRSFTCPFKTNVNENVDYMKYKTFSFGPVYEQNRQLEEFICIQIKRILESKGLVYEESNKADLMVQTNYTFEKNPDFSGEKKNIPTAYRYNSYKKQMEKTSIYYDQQAEARSIPFYMTFGVRLVDNKSLKTIWECEAKEWLSEAYKVDDYAFVHLPLMFMQYPYPKTLEAAYFLNTKIKYNFTGINYNINNLREIINVDIFSPAYQSNIKPGDIIEKINDFKIDATPEEFTRIYKRFIKHTMYLRDTTTTYTDANGFSPCMDWNPGKYRDILKAFAKKDNLTVFSYLFYFEPFINPSDKNVILFELKRKGEKKFVKIKPTVVEVNYLETY